MDTVTLTQIGNSSGIAIPSHYLEEIGLKKGQKFAIDRIPGTKNLIIVTEPHKKKTDSGVTKEFQDWLATFLKEDRGLLEELAHR